MNLADMILAAWGEDLDRPAEAMISSAGNDRTQPSAPVSLTAQRSRRELLAHAAAWQQRLEALGVGPGSNVALSPSRGPHLAPLHLATLSAGATVVPLNSALTPAEAAPILTEAAPTVTVTSSGVAEKLISLREAAKKTNDSDWLTEDEGPAPGDPAPEDPAVAEAHKDPADRVALMLYTSGTTGRPKAVPLTHRNLAANLGALAGLWQRSDQDVLLHALPAHHFHGLVLGLYGSLLAGNPIWWMERFAPRTALDAIAHLGIKLFMGVPTMYARMAAEAASADSLKPLRLAISGSAPMTTRLWRDVLEKLGTRVVERYGLTETCIVTSNPIDRPRPGTVGRPLPGVRLAIRDEDGRYHSMRELVAALPANAVRTDTDTKGRNAADARNVREAGRHARRALSRTNRRTSRQEATTRPRGGTPPATSIGPNPGNPAPRTPPPGAAVSVSARGTGPKKNEPERPGAHVVRGEICVTGLSVTSGYANNAEASAEAIHDGYFHTGDIGYVDGNGHLVIDGRAKELIIVGGSNVLPCEIERVLAEVQGVVEVAVAGIPDEDLGEIVAAFVVAAEPDSPATREDAPETPASPASPTVDPAPPNSGFESLQRALEKEAAARLSAYKRPRLYRFLRELPRNAMGKVQRAALRPD